MPSDRHRVPSPHLNSGARHKVEHDDDASKEISNQQHVGLCPRVVVVYIRIVAPLQLVAAAVTVTATNATTAAAGTVLPPLKQSGGGLPPENRTGNSSNVIRQDF